MNKSYLAIGLLVVLLHTVSADVLGYCKLQGTTLNPGASGHVLFVDDGTTVTVSIEATGLLNPGLHGVHIHEFGDLTSTSSVGSHYNPYGQPHGCPDTTSRHLGDTGNWTVDASGNISENKTLNLLTLTGPYSIIGRALVIHNETDNCVNVSSSGNRLAFCVIGIANPSTFKVTTNTAGSAQDNTTAICHLSPINNSGITGVVQITEIDAANVKVEAWVSGINGTHGFHLHTYGDLSDGISGNSTGAHFNPRGGVHALPEYPYVTSHNGDLGNIYYYETGIAYYSYTTNKINLVGAVNTNVVGRSIVVHQYEDQCTATSYGARHAFCVIGVKNPTTTFSIPVTTPTTQDTSACTAVYGTTTSTTGSVTGSVTGATTTGATTGGNASSAVSLMPLAALVLLLVASLL